MRGDELETIAREVLAQPTCLFEQNEKLLQ